MKIYHDRKDGSYFEDLKESLKKESIVKNAIKLQKSKVIEGKSYDKFIRIDYISMAASTLFDAGNLLDNNNIYQSFYDFLKYSNQLKEEGVFVKIRLLFQYLYSASSYVRIQAESAFNRGSVDEPSFRRKFTLTEQVDKETFDRSFLVSLQVATLKHVQDIEEDLRKNYGWNTRTNPSTLTVRFSTVNPMMCGLFINDKLYHDTYLLAKENRRSNKLAYSPLMSCCSKDHGFSIMEDHFRYCWELDSTMDCEDATHFKLNTPKSLSRIRPPQSVTFENKANRIASIENIAEEEKHVWRKRIKRQFLKLCSDLRPSQSNENIFITCSWDKEDDGITSPNEYAQLLSNFLNEDFSVTTPPILDIKIMEAAMTEFLSRQLYLSLDNSTIGIILLTKDIETKNGDFYCKPNVYHELGYLMKHIGKERILILSEKGVVIPSNVQDIVRLDFDEKRMSFRYHELVKHLDSMVNIPNNYIKKSLENNLKRLSQFLEEGKMESKEYTAIKTKIDQYKSSLKEK